MRTFDHLFMNGDVLTDLGMFQRIRDVSPLKHLPSRFAPRRFPTGGTLIFSYIRMLGPFILVQNFGFQYLLGYSEK